MTLRTAEGFMTVARKLEIKSAVEIEYSKKKLLVKSTVMPSTVELSAGMQDTVADPLVN